MCDDNEVGLFALNDTHISIYLKIKDTRKYSFEKVLFFLPVEIIFSLWHRFCEVFISKKLEKEKGEIEFMKRILLVCGAGMSTSLLVTKMQKAAKERGIEVEIAATSGESIDKEIENVDVLLLGPQIRYKEDEFKKKYGDKFPIEVIDPMDYGMMNGEKVLDFALKLIGEK